MFVCQHIHHFNISLCKWSSLQTFPVMLDQLLKKNAQMYKCSNAQILKCSNAQILKCSNAKILKRSNTQMLKCSNAKILKRSNAQMLKCSNTQLLKFLMELLECWGLLLQLNHHCTAFGWKDVLIEFEDFCSWRRRILNTWPIRF